LQNRAGGRIIPAVSDAIDAAVEYRCPGAGYAISRAVHLGRLAGFYPACRHCPHAADTGTLSPRQVRQLREVDPRGVPRPRFHEEGAGGVYGNEFPPADARQMAAALGICLRQTHCPPLVVLAGDGRPPGAALVAAASEGLRWAGCDLVDIGPATSPCLMLAIARLDAAGGILVGSLAGRPREVGLRFFAPGPCPVSRGPRLDAIERLCRQGMDRPARRCGSLSRAPAEAPYLASLSPYYHALRPLRLVLHAGSAPLWEYLQQLVALVACRVIPAGTGPSSDPATADRLGQQVRAQGAHLGLDIADDGETCRLYDEQGRAATAESLLLLLARHLLARQPHGVVVLEEGASSALAEAIESLGGRPVRSGPARAEMAAAMRRHGATTGGGPSGRCWHTVGDVPLPDALRTLTLLLVLLSRDDRPLSEVLDQEATVR
jgi:phosphomannomutase/phosphoglucomutase